MPNPSEPLAADELYRQALSLHQAGQLPQAEALYRQVLHDHPGHAEALHLLGVAHQQRGDHAQAAILIGKSLAIEGTQATPHSNLAIALHALGRRQEALAALDQALQIKPDYPEALSNRGNVLRETGHLREALASYDKALVARPDRLEIVLNRGQVLQELKREDEALAAFEHVLSLAPGNARALVGRGHALRSLHRHAQALLSYQRALQADPRNHAALVGMGNALQSLRRHPEALEAYGRALEVDPGALEVLNNRGSVLRDMKRYADAAEAFRLLAVSRPDRDYAQSNQLHSQLYCCDWSGYEAGIRRITERVMEGEAADVPFSFLAISTSPEAQLRCARRYVADHYPASVMPLPAPPARRDPRIHVAYLSSDFHAHATAYLMAGLFEKHDRESFRISAISFGPETNDPVRARLAAAFDDFVDVRRKSDLEAAGFVRSLGVDIAVDLKGFTAGNRAGILALRPAPLQVNYLGYPGTMGADYIDYLVADAVVVPPGDHGAYSEKIVTLPDSYQVNDSRRVISGREYTRWEFGLPPQAFVFCCFNNNYKITPEVFAVWMRLLKRVPGSVLWLLEDNADASRNLRSEANRSAVAPERLVFAARMPVEEHLARQRLADLFLDTLPCNAHTTASDALWAGLPVLTCPGRTFAGRVVGSLLHALQMPELVAATLDEYEALALELARNPRKLAAIRERLAERRTNAPLFNTDRLRRHLETAYRGMWQRHVRGEAPAAFSVPATDRATPP